VVAIAPFQLLRLARVGFVLAREGAFALVDPNEAPPAVRALIRIARLVERRGSADSAERLVTALTRLGPSYIKLGQFMATRPDVVGVRVARDLERLQDRIPPFAQSDAIHAIEAAFGKPLDQVFAEFSQPIAAASIAQVHRATTLQGETVAVKVLRPNVRYRFRRDLGAMAYAAALLESPPRPAA
jgi:ubiquinone biosynthesis protein